MLVTIRWLSQTVWKPVPPVVGMESHDVDFFFSEVSNCTHTLDVPSWNCYSSVSGWKLWSVVLSSNALHRKSPWVYTVSHLFVVFQEVITEVWCAGVGALKFRPQDIFFSKKKWQQDICQSWLTKFFYYCLLTLNLFVFWMSWNWSNVQFNTQHQLGNSMMIWLIR